MAKLYDRVMRDTESAGLSGWRADLLGGVDGRVLELGVGTGVNLPFYTDAVEALILSEPDSNMRARLKARLDMKPDQRIRISENAAEVLPFPDGHFDWVVSTLVLCSVSDPAQSLKEVYRVLRPGGGLVFIEHVCAKDRPDRYRWQRRIEPVWKWLADGCHLTRDTAAFIEDAGFHMASITRASMRKAPPVIRPTIRGVARKPSQSGHLRN